MLQRNGSHNGDMLKHNLRRLARSFATKGSDHFHDRWETGNAGPEQCMAVHRLWVHPPRP